MNEQTLKEQAKKEFRRLKIKEKSQEIRNQTLIKKRRDAEEAKDLKRLEGGL